MLHQYGLIGFPLGHSFSKRYFTEKFATEGIPAEYELYPLTAIDQMIDLISGHPDLKGLNVTIPFKKEVIPFLDELSEEARAIGAVNTISITRSGQSAHLKGWNTDAGAFESEIREFTGGMTGNALLLGNGGAAAAAIYVLKKLGWNVIRAVRKPLAGNDDTLLYSAIGREIMQSVRLIVNATPAGMFPESDTMPPVPVELITSQHFIFDMVYNPEVTRLMKEGLNKGASVRNGLGMLHRQAELAWKIWTESSGM
ncbi:MAG: shikimate dehydrogenase [Bacteroidetes bacterium]|nr:MAG: shikimate dehydrogenase [Bacteroidota bacterium]